MKKHLIAAAVAAAVAVPAMAQNVTLSGNLEANYGRIDSGAGSTAGMNGGVDVFGGSDFKISGSEDLGGGLKAGFSLLMEFNENNGSNINTLIGATPNQSNDRTWRDIQLFVGGGFGEVKVGRFIAAHRDLGGVYRFNGDFGRIAGGFNTVGNRPDNQIQYTSPAISGVTVSVAHAKADANGVVTAGSQSGYSIRFVDGPLRLQYSNASIKSAANVKDKESAIGGSYTLGNIRLGAAYFEDKTEVVATQTEGVTLQADVDMGGGINLFGSFNSYEATANNADGTAYAIGVSKALSKRTKVFAVHNNDKNDTAATWVFRNGTAPAAGNDSSRTVIGLAHSF
jgi:predicted porin